MRRPGNRLVAALALAAGLGAPAAATPAAAATPWYQIEVVVFALGGESRWDRDDWREEGPPPLPENTVELLGAFVPADEAGGSKRRHAFRTLPASELGLKTAANRLDRSEAYRVLLHVGWRQPGFPYDDAPAVRFDTRRGLVSDDRFAAAPGEAVDGTVRLWRRRFLHVHADLAFGDLEAWSRRKENAAGNARPQDGSVDAPGAGAGTRARAAETSAPGTTARTAASAAARHGAAGEGAEDEAGGEADLRPAGDGERLRVVRLTRSLRLRAGRLYYLDHPLFGMLLEVKRLR